MNRLSGEEKANLFEEVINAISPLEGEHVIIKESISRANACHDKHLATKSIFNILLNKASWAISGGRLIIEGQESYYEIAFDIVSKVLISNIDIQITEQFNENIQRLTVIAKENA